MEIWYKVSVSLINYIPIKKVKILRFTEKSVWIENKIYDPSRSAKRSNYENFFPTYKEAKDFLVKYQQAKEKGVKLRAEDELKKLYKVFQIKEEDIK